MKLYPWLGRRILPLRNFRGLFIYLSSRTENTNNFDPENFETILIWDRIRTILEVIDGQTKDIITAKDRMFVFFSYGIVVILAELSTL